MQVFRLVIVPSILPTIAVVTTYMVINAMKVFDIVFVRDGERQDERNRGGRRADRPFGSSSTGTTVAERRSQIILFVAVIPVMIWNVKRFRQQEEEAITV